MEYSLIANTGIHVMTFQIEVNTQDPYKMWFHEWYDKQNGEWRLDAVYKLDSEDVYYNKKDIFEGGYFNVASEEISTAILKEDGIFPIKVDDEMSDGIDGEVYKINFQDKQCCLSDFENQWLPVPYFFKKTSKRLSFGPLNWSRMKLLPAGEYNGIKKYNVVLAFDTRAGYEANEYNEYPVFPDKYRKDMRFEVCDNDFQLMDYCSSNEEWGYINAHLMKLSHPEVQRISQIKGKNVQKTAYSATYIYLIDYIVRNSLFPSVTLFKDDGVEYRKVDMVVDVGNSKTTAILIEDGVSLKNVQPLELTDYTSLINTDGEKSKVCKYSDPFDMRVTFRKVKFGRFGINNSPQFVYPSFVRLGNEANSLIRKSSSLDDDTEKLCTYSSPKRFLWDNMPSKEEWRFLVMKDEPADDCILNIPGLSNFLRSDGTIDETGNGGSSYHYSRRSLMTFAFLEMLLQAWGQVNEHDYRYSHGNKSMPRRISRLIVTCPTAMSHLEREAMVKCANDAIRLISLFYGKEIATEVYPKYCKDEQSWYYDEATCSQLVYMYGEISQKYKGCCKEFFDLYGKGNATLTIGSLDIGAGTTDLMINEYKYEEDNVTEVKPIPKFYDSFYYAGDDMLKALVKNVMLIDEGNNSSAFRAALSNLGQREYRQLMKNFFGADYNGQTVVEKKLRRDFNVQYSVPLMNYFLGLLSSQSRDCTIEYKDVFTDCEPNQYVLDGFKNKTGIDVTKLVWNFNYDYASSIVKREFEPLLRKISAILYACSCDIVILSGRPSSLPAIRELFLKYYPVAPNKLIVLNNYYVGDWYPFSNNTGYIKNPKTIVAIGGAIAYYSIKLSSMNDFVLDLSSLKALKSTVNYIEPAREGRRNDYIITPQKSNGKIVVNELPSYLRIRQLGLDSYPSRILYAIDFNSCKLRENIREKARAKGENMTDGEVLAALNEKIDTFKSKMPFTISLERDSEDIEKLSVESVEDSNGNEFSRDYFEVDIQSLGINYNYWLDTGSFDF
ncbi:virulence factor SrfB [Prevotella lacticifex]|nr:virulence factor SrfB [Prevotella lacticifex]